MNRVLFPGFDLSFHLDPVAFTVFGQEIYWYGIIIAAGFLGAVFFTLHIAHHFGVERDDVLDMLLFATPGAIIGARLYYIVFYLDNFRKADGSLDFVQMLRIHDGGNAIYGAILAAVLIAILVTRYKKIPFLAMADLSSFGLLFGQAVGRWGNFVNVEAYGGETSVPWRMGIVEGGTYLEVHPTFLYESLWNLLGLALLLLVFYKGLRKFDGMLFSCYVLWYGLGRSVIEGLRTDSLYLFGTDLRVSQLLAILSAVAALCYLIYRLRKKPQAEELYVMQQTKESEVADDVSDDS